jgi:hypothetical protein
VIGQPGDGAAGTSLISAEGDGFLKVASWGLVAAVTSNLVLRRHWAEAALER